MIERFKEYYEQFIPDRLFYWDKYNPAISELMNWADSLFSENYSGIYTVVCYMPSSVREQITEEEWCTLINFYPYVFTLAPNKTQKILKATVTRNLSYIDKIENPTDDLWRLALSGDVSVAYYLHPKKQIDLIKWAIEKYPECFSHIRDKTEEICLYAVSLYPYLLDYIDTELQTERVVLKAVETDKTVVKYVASNSFRENLEKRFRREKLKCFVQKLLLCLSFIGLTVAGCIWYSYYLQFLKRVLNFLFSRI